MTISTERLQEMLAAAEKATPGPWQLLNVGDGRRAKAPADEVGISLLTIVSEGEVDFAAVYEDADAAHIDNCDPDTIRELITELLASRSGVGGREAVGAPELANEMFEVLFNETRDCVPESITDELLTKVAEAIIAGYSIERRAG